MSTPTRSGRPGDSLAPPTNPDLRHFASEATLGANSLNQIISQDVPPVPQIPQRDLRHIGSSATVVAQPSIDNLTGGNKKRFAAPNGDPEKAEALPEAPEQQQQQNARTAPAAPGVGDFPDGGFRAWSVAFGAFFCLFVSFGWVNCIGIFQDYYQTDMLKQDSASKVSWITSLETFIMFAFGSVWGRMYDVYGPRVPLLVASFLHVFGLMMTSLSTKYYQFILAQGICSSLGACGIFFIAVSSVSTWFNRKRAFAIGLVASGSSLGGVVFPIFVQNLIPKIGFPWTMRACAFMILGLMIVANLTVASRLPPHPSKFSFLAFVKPFREKVFLMLSCSSFLFFLGIFIPFDFLILQAETLGIRPELAQYLIPILNAVSILGRTLPAYLGDKVGRFNILTVFCYLAGILVLALWLPAKGEAAIVVFAALYGLASGVFVSMVPACVAQISPIREIGIRNGSIFAFSSIAALFGNPIAGALAADNGYNYSHVQIFAGILMLAGSTGMLLTRLSMGGISPLKAL